MMKRVGKTAFWMFLALWSVWSAGAFQQAARAQAAADDYDYDDWEEGEDEEDPFGGILYPIFPSIEDVKFDPAAPAAGQEVTVTAKITLSMEDEEEEDAVKEAVVEYTAGGKSGAAAMTASGDVFTGKIPGQPAGTTVKFAIRATDNFGNVSRELICSGAQLSDAAADMDNDGELVPDDLDLLKTSVGCDADRYYVGFNVQGKVHGGTIDPPYMHLYGLKFTNPDLDEGEGLMIGKLLAFIPLAKEAGEAAKAKGLSDGFIVPDFGLLDIKKANHTPTIAEAMMKEAETTHSDAGTSAFTASFKRSALGELGSGYFRMIGLTVANASLESFMPIPLNATPYTQVYTRSHEYAVK